MRNEKKIRATLGNGLPVLLFDMLRSFHSVAIEKLHKELWPSGIWTPTLTPRVQQQRVGAVVCMLNKKLGVHDLRVLPGNERRTYRLVRVIDYPVR